MDLTAMHRISYGLYVIGSRKEDAINGQTANAVMQVTSDPVRVTLGINKQNLTHEYIHAGGQFTVSVLEKETPLALIAGFGFKSGRDTDKFGGVQYSLTGSGLPFLEENVLAYLEAELVEEMDAGTHTVFLGEVIGAEVLKEGDPMTYAYYHQVKRGTVPRTAPTYLAGKNKE